jgi:hypothetical protein
VSLQNSRSSSWPHILASGVRASVKLLLDENLSPAAAVALAGEAPPANDHAPIERRERLGGPVGRLPSSRRSDTARATSAPDQRAESARVRCRGATAHEASRANARIAGMRA